MPNNTDTKHPTYSLAKRGKRYCIQWWENGSSRRISLRTENKDEARKLFRQFLAGIDTAVAKENVSIEEILHGYLKSKLGKVSSYQTLMHACTALNEHIGHVIVEYITLKTSLDYVDTRKKQGRRGRHSKNTSPLSNGTIIRELVTLRAALKWAYDEKLIDRIPTIKVPKSPPPKDVWLSKQQAKKLMDSADMPHLKLFIKIAIFTGARTRAILDLKWEQIDFARNIINFGEGTGNKKRAIIPITEKLLQILKTHAEIRCSDYVIEFNGKPIKSIKTAFNKATKKAGLTNVTPHTLRHTAATWMVISGVPLPMIAKFLGNSVEMIERVYGHHSPDWLKQASDALSA